MIAASWVALHACLHCILYLTLKTIVTHTFRVILQHRVQQRSSVSAGSSPALSNMATLPPLSQVAQAEQVRWMKVEFDSRF